MSEQVVFIPEDTESLIVVCLSCGSMLNGYSVVYRTDGHVVTMHVEHKDREMLWQQLEDLGFKDITSEYISTFSNRNMKRYSREVQPS